jgi:molecular chaperone DnaK (HSP70)
MPAVAVALKKEFGWDARLTDPDLAVAKGAALYAAGRTIRWVEEHGEGDGPQAADRDDVIRTVAESTGVGEQELTAIAGRRLVNVLPKAIGLKLIDTSRSNWQDDPASAAYVQHLVQAQTSLPFMAEPFVAQTVSDAQPQIEIELWEQAGSVADRSLEANKAIDQGRSVITDLAPYALPQGSPINIGLEVDDEGTVTVRAVEPHSGKQLDMRVQISVLSPEQVAGAREVHSGLSIGT